METGLSTLNSDTANNSIQQVTSGSFSTQSLRCSELDIAGVVVLELLRCSFENIHLPVTTISQLTSKWIDSTWGNQFPKVPSFGLRWSRPILSFWKCLWWGRMFSAGTCWLSIMERLVKLCWKKLYLKDDLKYTQSTHCSRLTLINLLWQIIFNILSLPTPHVLELFSHLLVLTHIYDQDGTLK